MNTLFYPNINQYITSFTVTNLSNTRLHELQNLIAYIQEKKDKKLPIHLNFICTHNSRRSQFAQVWSHMAAIYYDITNLYTYSSGTSITACDPRTIHALSSIGFKIITQTTGKQNMYALCFSPKESLITLYSKLTTQVISRDSPFAAIMMCTQADQNCPLLPNADKRISLPHNDPKVYDDTPIETKKYAEASLQIATELFYVMSQLS